MHILFLTDNFPPETNAPASRTYEHARVWVAHGHEVTVITGAPNFPVGRVYDGYKNNWLSREKIDGINIIRIKTFITANEGFALRSLDFMSFMISGAIAGLFVKKPSVVVATSPQFFTAIAGWFVAFVRRRPFVFELRDIWPASLAAVGMKQKKLIISISEKIELFLYRQASLIVSVTHSFKEDLIGRNIDGSKIEVVLNGVDLGNFTVKNQDRSEWRNRFGLGEKFVIGYVGTHGMAHGLGSILECAKELRDEENIAFVFIGEGAEKAKLESDITKLELKNVFSFPGQPKAHMPNILSMLDVSLVSLRDTELFKQVIPSKIFESMGAGLPMIISVPEGEATRIVTGDGAGLTCPPENPMALARLVLKLYQEDEFRAQLGVKSFAASKNYDREVQAKNMMALLERFAN